MSATQPFPYQGSKRAQAVFINDLARQRGGRMFEPFAGSAAVSLERLTRDAKAFVVLNDADPALMALWSVILSSPAELCRAYRSHHEAQSEDPKAYFVSVRERFNLEHRPADLLYLINRCVKGAVRYNQRGEFNQGADHRRLGAQPFEVERRVFGAHRLLKDRCVLKNEDFSVALSEAVPNDIVYMDPPYQGTSEGRDGRYRFGLSRDRLIVALEDLVRRDVPFLLSYDGTGPQGSYGATLPDSLAVCIEVRVGRSAQATLLGRQVETMERLYVSRNIVATPLGAVSAKHYSQPSLL